LLENVMRKPRDFERELKALQDKARDLKSRKVLGLGELIIATGADSLSADELAGALIMLAETKDTARKEAWAKRGVAFFQSRSRRTAPAAERHTGGARAQPGGPQPSTGSKGAA
jgi:DNA-binding protein H-NS